MRAAKLASTAFALAAVLWASPAGAGRMTDFDLTKLDNWSDALAVCDITRFLLTDPDTNADAILVPGRDNTHIALYKPLYAPPTNFFSRVMRDAFDHVKAAGLTNEDLYGRARIHYAGRMIAAYSGASLTDKHYMADQMELCYHLAVRAGVKLTPVMREKP